MKFFATAALISVVAAACEEGGDNICVAKEGEEDGQRCIKRVTTETPKASDKKYKAALKADSTLAKDFVFYQCSFKADATALVEASGKEDAKSKVTFTYEDVTPADEGAGSGAIALKGAAFAALLGVVAYM